MKPGQIITPTVPVTAKVVNKTDFARTVHCAERLEVISSDPDTGEILCRDQSGDELQLNASQIELW